MKILMTIVCFLPVLAFAHLDDSVSNGASDPTSKKFEFKNDSAVFVGASDSKKTEQSDRKPASLEASDFKTEFQFAQDSYETGASIK